MISSSKISFSFNLSVFRNKHLIQYSIINTLLVAPCSFLFKLGLYVGNQTHKHLKTLLSSEIAAG
jgi:hypothetical protein